MSYCVACRPVTKQRPLLGNDSNKCVTHINVVTGKRCSVRQLRDTTMEEMFGTVFSVQSVPICYVQDKFWLVVRESPACKGVSMEAMEAVTSQLAKTSRLRKLNACCSVVQSAYELVIEL
jgi:hypothetical protein